MSKGQGKDWMREFPTLRGENTNSVYEDKIGKAEGKSLYVRKDVLLNFNNFKIILTEKVDRFRRMRLSLPSTE